MGSWRTFLIGAAAIVATAALGGLVTSIHVVLPPMGAALLVLLIAAVAVDYFGFVRRHHGWTGSIAPTTASRAALAALERRFHRERRRGGVRVGATARALLVSLAEHRELRRAGDVCDLLAADAATRAHRDVVCDALRAAALAELGRLPEARRVEADLGARAAAIPVVAWARARIREAAGDPRAALAELARALRGDDRAGARRDLGILRARLLVRTGRAEDARVELARVAASGGRALVEALGAADDAGVAIAARQALGLAAVYR